MEFVHFQLTAAANICKIYVRQSVDYNLLPFPLFTENSPTTVTRGMVVTYDLSIYTESNKRYAVD